MSKFQVYKDAAGYYRWRLVDSNGAKIASSGESFYSRDSAVRAVRNVIAECKKNPPIV